MSMITKITSDDLIKIVFSSEGPTLIETDGDVKEGWNLAINTLGETRQLKYLGSAANYPYKKILEIFLKGCQIPFGFMEKNGNLFLGIDIRVWGKRIRVREELEWEQMDTIAKKAIAASEKL